MQFEEITFKTGSICTLKGNLTAIDKCFKITSKPIILLVVLIKASWLILSQLITVM